MASTNRLEATQAAVRGISNNPLIPGVLGRYIQAPDMNSQNSTWLDLDINLAEEN